MSEEEWTGYQLMRLRKLCGCSQEELAFNAGISTYYLRQIEHGEANPSLDVLLRIHSALYAMVTGQDVSPPMLSLDLLLREIPVWRYYIVRETRYDPDIGAFPTLGIQAEVQRRGSWETAEMLHDVTLDFSALQSLISLCNQLQLSPLHLRDVVEAIL